MAAAGLSSLPFRGGKGAAVEYLKLPMMIFSRRRPLAAACLSVLSFVMLWMGFGVSNLLPLPRVAVAESAPMDHHNAPPIISSERAGLLQSSVDSVALGLGSALATLSDESARKSALGSALSSLTFELGGDAYFTAWHGTRIMHSPLTPDTTDMDFSDALDERGSAFVLTMESVANNGGGFVRVTLPRQLPRRIPAWFAAGGEVVSAPLHMNIDDAMVIKKLDSLSASIIEKAAAKETVAFGQPLKTAPVVRGLGSSGALTPENPIMAEYGDEPLNSERSKTPVSSIMDSTPVEQVVYIRRIPQTAWHIAAFMPAEASPGFEGQGFSLAWSAVAADKSARLAAENDFRNGLCVSGFSLAGLVGLMMAPGRNRNENRRGIL